MQICDAILRENRGIKDHNRDNMYYFLFSAYYCASVFTDSVSFQSNDTKVTQTKKEGLLGKRESLSFIRN